MTDFTALVSSEEWKPLVEAVAVKMFARSCGGMLPDFMASARMENAMADARLFIADLLAAAVDKGVAREAAVSELREGWLSATYVQTDGHDWFPAFIIKTGDK